jgi:hypothetical protein
VGEACARRGVFGPVKIVKVGVDEAGPGLLSIGDTAMGDNATVAGVAAASSPSTTSGFSKSHGTPCLIQLLHLGWTSSHCVWSPSVRRFAEPRHAGQLPLFSSTYTVYSPPLTSYVISAAALLVCSVLDRRLVGCLHSFNSYQRCRSSMSGR